MSIDPSQAPDLLEKAQSEADKTPVAKLNATMEHANYGLAAAQRGIKERGAQQEKELGEASLHSLMNMRQKQGQAEEQGEDLFTKSQRAIAKARQDRSEKPVPEPTQTHLPRALKLS